MIIVMTFHWCDLIFIQKARILSKPALLNILLMPCWSFFVLAQVFEKGLMAIPLSIDLWIHYINFANKKYEGDPEKTEKMRM